MHHLAYHWYAVTHAKMVDRINTGTGGGGRGRTDGVLIVDIRSTRPLFSPRVARGLMLTRQGTRKKKTTIIQPAAPSLTRDFFRPAPFLQRVVYRDRFRLRHINVFHVCYRNKQRAVMGVHQCEREENRVVLYTHSYERVFESFENNVFSNSFKRDSN